MLPRTAFRRLAVNARSTRTTSVRRISALNSTLSRPTAFSSPANKLPQRFAALHTSAVRNAAEMDRGTKLNFAPEPDQVLKDIADYVHDYEIKSDLAVRHSPVKIEINWNELPPANHQRFVVRDCPSLLD